MWCRKIESEIDAPECGEVIDVCSVLMVRVAEMRSVGHVFDELAEQSGTDRMTGSWRVSEVYTVCGAIAAVRRVKVKCRVSRVAESRSTASAVRNRVHSSCTVLSESRYECK